MKTNKPEVMDVAKAKATGAERKENADLDFGTKIHPKHKFPMNTHLYEARVMGYQIDMDSSFNSLVSRMAQRHATHQPVSYWQINTTTNRKHQVMA